jgi:6-phosphogluconate dehydrogenase (decarboxylating)
MQVAALPLPRVVWLMLPAGVPTQQTIDLLGPMLSAGDIVIDGGNANYLDSQARGRALTARGLEFIDCGVSGGVWGLQNGYCLMYGASATAAQAVGPYHAVAGGVALGWLASLRSCRRWSLRQDDPQRHRIRDDAGAGGRLRAARGQAGVRPEAR